MTVYFVATKDERYIKIGMTRGDVDRRVAALESAHPEELVIVALCEGDAALEKTLHRFFYKHRARGEWFHFSEEIRNFVEATKSRARRPYGVPEYGATRVDETVPMKVKEEPATTVKKTPQRIQTSYCECGAYAGIGWDPTSDEMTVERFCRRCSLKRGIVRSSDQHLIDTIRKEQQNHEPWWGWTSWLFYALAWDVPDLYKRYCDDWYRRKELVV